MLIKIILGGTRTPNLEIRSLTPYPLGHEDALMVSASTSTVGGGCPRRVRIQNISASCRVRTCAFFRILELKSSALDHSAKKASSLKERAPAGSRTRVLQLGTVDDNRYTTGAECINTL